MIQAAAYLISDSIYLRACRRTDQGIFILYGGVVVASAAFEPISLRELGVAVLQVLSDSHGIVPHPTDWSSVGDPLLKATKSRNWQRLQDKARGVSVYELEGGEIKIVPLARTPGEKGYGASTAAPLVTNSSQRPEKIGECLWKAFSLAI